MNKFIINKGCGMDGVVPHVLRISNSIVITEDDDVEVEGVIYRLDDEDKERIQGIYIDAVLYNIAIVMGMAYRETETLAATVIISSDLKLIKEYIEAVLSAGKPLVEGNDSTLPYLWEDVAQSFHVKVPMLSLGHIGLRRIAEYITEEVVGNKIPKLSKELTRKIMRAFLIRVDDEGSVLEEIDGEYELTNGVSIGREDKALYVRVDGDKHYLNGTQWKKLLDAYIGRKQRRVKKTNMDVPLHDIVVISNKTVTAATPLIFKVAYLDLMKYKSAPFLDILLIDKYGPLKLTEADYAYIQGFVRTLLLEE